MGEQGTTCAGCRYSRRRDGEIYCHRKPPEVIYTGDGDAFSTWPRTEDDEWCGEYAGRLQS